MSRQSVNEEVAGVVKNGFDYDLQVWVKDYIVIDCGHPEYMQPDCCNMHTFAEQDIRNIKRG